MKIGILTQGGGNYSSQRLKEAIRERGHKSTFINPLRCYVDIEQDRPEIRYQRRDISNLDALIPRVGPRITKYGSAVVRQFEMMGVYTSTKSIAINRSRDKLRSLQIMTKAGVGIPKSVFASQTAEIDDIINQFDSMPIIIKLNKGTHGKGVVLAETKKAAKSVMQAFYVQGASFLVQEYIEESSGTDIRAIVVGGKVIAGMKRQSLTDDFRSNLHAGGEGVKVKLTKEERDAARKAARAMGLGVAGVDMLQSNRGPLVLEVNSSPGLQGIESVTNKDIAGRIVDHVIDKSQRRAKKDSVGA